MNNTFEDLYNITVSSHRNSDAIVYFESKNRKIITFNEYDELTKGYAVLFEEVLSDTDRGSWVGMQLPNSHIWFAVLFALQKTGYNVVLIDENAGENLVRHFIKQTGMKALVTFRNCFYDDVKCINMAGLQPKGCTCSKPEQAWSSKMAFCTSGTTGTAKVYVFNSSAIVHSCQNIVDFYYRNDDLNTKGKEGADGENPILALPLRHISGFILAFAFWTLGKCLVLPNGKGILNIIETVREEKIWLLFCVPAMWKAILQIMKVKYKKADANGFKELLGTGLKVGISAAASLDDGLADVFRKSGIEFLNCWGMTETGICSIGRISEADTGSYVGSSVNGHDIKVMTEEGNLKSGTGELRLEGKALFEAVMKDGVEIRRTESFSTGDIFRYEKGKLFFLGRCKSVIVGESGENVYPEEIDMYFDFLSGKVHSYCTVGYKDEPVLFVGIDKAHSEAEYDSIAEAVREVNQTLPAVKQLTKLFIVNKGLPHTSKGEPARMKLTAEFVETNDIKMIKMKGRKV